MEIVDITDPVNPVEVYWSPGISSTWRDIKTWRNFAYITNESGEGLEIINLNNLPYSATSTYFTGGILTGTTTNVSFTTAHNLYIDEKGIAYIFGANYGVGGAIMLSVRANPTNPPVLGVYDVRYCHDGYVRNNILYTAEIYQGLFSIVDLDKLNPVVLGKANTTSNFTHNVWLSDNGNYLFTTDEVGGAEIGAYDISDVTDIKRVDGIKSGTGNNATVHNTHVLNDFLITSYYTDGLTIVDANCPDILVEVARYDTNPPSAPSSGIASDMGNGLFILDNNYKPASYLTGKVTGENGNTLNNVQVKVSNVPQGSTTTDIFGDYKMGITGAGTHTVVFSAEGYNPVTRTVNFETGVKAVENVQLLDETAACPATLSIDGSINAGIYQADDFITSSGKISSSSNGKVTFNAGYYTDEYIELLINFEVDGSFDFIAENIQCDTTD